MENGGFGGQTEAPAAPLGHGTLWDRVTALETELAAAKERIVLLEGKVSSWISNIEVSQRVQMEGL